MGEKEVRRIWPDGGRRKAQEKPPKGVCGLAWHENTAKDALGTHQLQCATCAVD